MSGCSEGGFVCMKVDVRLAICVRDCYAMRGTDVTHSGCSGDQRSISRCTYFRSAHLDRQGGTGFLPKLCEYVTAFRQKKNGFSRSRESLYPRQQAGARSWTMDNLG
eukprot:414816-Rhodomonas_salina.3